MEVKFVKIQTNIHKIYKKGFLKVLFSMSNIIKMLFN
jgi:hypothetical protein